MRNLFAMLIPALLLATGCATVPINTLPDPHHHTSAVHQQKSSPYHVGDMEAIDPQTVMIRVEKDAEQLPNPSGKLVAMLGTTIHTAMGYAVPVVVFFREGRSYVCFVSHTWPNRIIDNLVWIDNRHLAFDLFAGDNIGWHYVVDAKSEKAVFATPFIDQDEEPAPAAPPR